MAWIAYCTGRISLETRVEKSANCAGADKDSIGVIRRVQCVYLGVVMRGGIFNGRLMGIRWFSSLAVGVREREERMFAQLSRGLRD